MYLGLLFTNSSELVVFKENYASLCKTITDINELLKYFVAEKIININQEEDIKACSVKSERVSKLLLIVAGPLEAGDIKGFYKMLKIMKTYGVDATQRLADYIITKVDKSKLPDLVGLNLANSIHEDWNKGLL